MRVNLRGRATANSAALCSVAFGQASLPSVLGGRRNWRAAMALAALSGDEQGIVFTQLCNVLDPRLAVALSSINNELLQ